jgi:hypothetical protein
VGTRLLRVEAFVGCCWAVGLDGIGRNPGGQALLQGLVFLHTPLLCSGFFTAPVVWFPLPATGSVRSGVDGEMLELLKATVQSKKDFLFLFRWGPKCLRQEDI